MKKYIAVLELEADEESIEADVKYNYSSNGKDYSIIENVWFEEERKEKSMKTYEDGLNEAWELARKIVCTTDDGGKPVEWLEDTFGSARTNIIFRNYSVSEAIKQVAEHEYIEVGDEVEFNSNKGVILEFDDDSSTIMIPSGRTVNVYDKGIIKKTGRHFPQIEEVLKQMQEGKE